MREIIEAIAWELLVVFVSTVVIAMFGSGTGRRVLALMGAALVIVIGVSIARCCF